VLTSVTVESATGAGHEPLELNDEDFDEDFDEAVEELAVMEVDDALLVEVDEVVKMDDVLLEEIDGVG
jgi:hypothetical protein